MALENLISTFDLINNLVGAGMFFVGLFSLGKATAQAVRGISGHESTGEAIDNVKKWGKDLKKKDEKIWHYNNIANKLAEDLNKEDMKIEAKLEKIKELLIELKKIDESHNPKYPQFKGGAQ